MLLDADSIEVASSAVLNSSTDNTTEIMTIKMPTDRAETETGPRRSQRRGRR
jgi:hypothetical protein